MPADLVIEHRGEIAALLAAAAGFGLVLLVAWPRIAAHDLMQRLREQVSDGDRRRTRRQERAGDAPPATGLRREPSRLPARLAAAFRIADRLHDRTLVQRLRQAGFRGHDAALKYATARIVSPLAALAIAGLYAFAVIPDAALSIRAAILAGGGVLGWFLPPLLLKNRIDKRMAEIGRAWPDAVDVMLICVEAGMSIEQALRKVAEEMAPASIELAKETSLTAAELDHLRERRKAYENLALRVDIDSVKAVAGTLSQSERHGTPLGRSLRVMAEESRAMRIAAAEKKAASLPPRLTVPMIVFFLPVLFAIIVTPAVLRYLNG